MKKIKKIYFILPLILLMIGLIIPSANAIYTSGTRSSAKSKFKIQYNSVYIRASILTYWIDPTTNEIIGKTGWDFDDTKISNQWVKIDDYYYYKGVLSKDVLISSDVPADKELVNINLNVSDLTNDDITGEKYTAKYKVVYEILEVTEESGIKSCETAWGITYTADGVPNKM